MKALRRVGRAQRYPPLRAATDGFRYALPILPVFSMIEGVARDSWKLVWNIRGRSHSIPPKPLPGLLGSDSDPRMRPDLLCAHGNHRQLATNPLFRGFHEHARFPCPHPLPLCSDLRPFPGPGPFVPEPHVWEKLKMLADGTLSRPIDIFDLCLHGAPWLVLFGKIALGQFSLHTAQD